MILRGTLLPEISTEILKTMSAELMLHTLNLGIDPAGHFTYRFLTDGGGP